MSDPKPTCAPPIKDACPDALNRRDSPVDLQRAIATGNFTTAEAAYFLGVSQKTIWNWRYEGKIHAKTLGNSRTLRFHINELNKFLRN